MSSRGRADQGRGQPEPLAHAERVGADRAAVDAGRGRPARAPRRSGARGSTADRAGPMASSRERFARPDRPAYAAGPSTSAPDVGQHLAGRPGHRPAEHLDRAGGGQHQAEQHPDRRGLARPVRRRGSRRCRPPARRGRRPSTARDVAEALGQPFGADHGPLAWSLPVGRPPGQVGGGLSSASSVTVPVSSHWNSTARGRGEHDPQRTDPQQLRGRRSLRPGLATAARRGPPRRDAAAAGRADGSARRRRRRRRGRPGRCGPARPAVDGGVRGANWSAASAKSSSGRTAGGRRRARGTGSRPPAGGRRRKR